jgi:hypothetical protein
MYTLSLRRYYMTSDSFLYFSFLSTIRTSFFFFLLFVLVVAVAGTARDWLRWKIKRLEATVQSCWKTHTAHGRPSFLSFFLSCPVETSCFTVERIAHNTTHVDTHTNVQYTYKIRYMSSRCPVYFLLSSL